MTPKEEAKELVLLFTNHYISCPHTRIKIAKEYALICADKILKVINKDNNYQNVYVYFLEVKQEIEKL